MSKTILKVVHLDKHYGSLHAINDVSFDISGGEIVGLLGHNGAGKSTLIKCLMGVIRSYDGGIFMSGKDIRRRHYAIRESAGFLLEPCFCDYMSANANLEMFNSLSEKPDSKRVQEVLELVSLKKFANKKVGGFSFGMRERLGLAQVLLTQPDLIVLDEPTVGLDPLGVEIIKNIIVDCSKRGIAVLFSSHQLSDVLDICHRAVVMNEGSIVYDGPASELTKKYFKIHLRCDIGAHIGELKRIAPELELEGNTICLSDSETVNNVLVYLVRHDLPVADLDLDSSMDDLKKLMV